MAGPNRRPPSHVSGQGIYQQLFKEGDTFAFFQAVRLLRLAMTTSGKAMPDLDILQEHVRMRPNLALAHPGTELDSVDELPDGPPYYRITSNFLGIYGESSPLPGFYTEDLLHEPYEQRSVTREFLDILNMPLYLLFYQIWSKHRLGIKVVEERDQVYIQILLSLLGLGVEDIEKDIDELGGIFHYLGLLTLYPKSGKGLETLLKDALHTDRLEIIPCMKRTVRIPTEQRLHLGASGNMLGEECYLGETIEDRTRKYRVKIGPMKAHEFRKLTPGGEMNRKLATLSRLYLVDPYESDLQLLVEAGEIRGTRLGEKEWSMLGGDAWIFSGELREPAEVIL